MLRARVQAAYNPFHNSEIRGHSVRNVLVREVIKPLSARFPSTADEQGFKDGRLHSFRHYFASTCANAGIPERIVMEWLGHADSEMVRHYYHLHDDESRRQMDRLHPVNNAGNRPTGNNRAENTKPTETTDPGEPVATAT
jgi:integrase